MNKKIILTITVLFLAVCFAGAVSAETVDDNLETVSQDTSENVEPVDEQADNVTITGEVRKCSDGQPFTGATVTASANGETLASTITDTNGQYQLKLQSNDTNFQLTATAQGHNIECQDIKIEPGNNSYTANFILGMDNVYVSILGSDTTGDGTQGNPYRTIQKGINEVNTNGTVHVANGTYNEAITINKSLNLIGENQSNTIIDAAGLNNRVITISIGTVTITNLIIQNGNIINTVHDGGYAEARGGGISIMSTFATVTINNCTIQNNSITAISIGFDGYAEAYGGGIINFGTLIINNCTIQNNIATAIATEGRAYARGGGIYHSRNTLTILKSTIKNNSNNATAGSANANTEGGGIYNSDTGTLNIANCTIINNINNATGGIPYAEGGGIYNHFGTLTANYNRIVGNSNNALNNFHGFSDVRYNWWGYNNPDFASLVVGTDNYSPWMYMTILADPNNILFGEQSTITVSFNNLFDGTTVNPLDPLMGHIPDGTPITFNTDLGSIGSKTTEKETLNGMATAMLTANETVGTAHVNAVNDSQTTNTEINIDPINTKTDTENKNNFAGQNVDLTAQVKDDNGKTVNEGRVQFSVNGGIVGTADVVNGQATYTYTIPDWNPGNYPIIAQYQGTENYLPSTDTATLTVNYPVPVASFTGSPTSGRADLTVKFTNTSTGTITSYEWDFGDGFKSNAASPSHTYTKPGVYTVKLTVRGPGGTSTQTRSQYIIVKLPDLVMQSVTAPSTARRGGTIRVSSRVRNSGTISTGKGFYVAFYLRSTKTSRRYYIGRRWVGNLGVGVSSSKTNYYRIPRTLPRGRYYVQAVADYTKIIREITRSNNIKYTTGRTSIT